MHTPFFLEAVLRVNTITPIQGSTWASLAAQQLKNLPAMQEILVQFLVRKIPWRQERLPTPGFLGVSDSSDGEESTWNAGDLGSIPGLGRYPGRGWENPVEISCLENPHGQRNLMGYSPWGHRELDTTERLDTAQQKDPHLRFTKTNKKKVSQVAQW